MQPLPINPPPISAMPATPADLFARLEGLGIETQTVTHEALFTVEQSRGLYERLSGAHTKNLFLIDKKGRLFLVIAEHHAEIDLKHLHRRIGATGRLSFGKPELPRETVSIDSGWVTAFASINDTEGRIEVLTDAPLSAYEHINRHPLVNPGTTQIAYDVPLRFLRATGHEPRIVPVSGPEP